MKVTDTEVFIGTKKYPLTEVMQVTGMSREELEASDENNLVPNDILTILETVESCVVHSGYATVHTPGPWTCNDNRFPSIIYDEYGTGEGFEIARVNTDGIRHSEAVANGKLLSAAPRLKAALEDLLRRFDDPVDAPWQNDADLQEARTVLTGLQ